MFQENNEASMVDNEPHVTTTHIKIGDKYVDGFSSKFIMEDAKRDIYYIIYEMNSETRIAYLFDRPTRPITIGGMELEWERIIRSKESRKRFGGFLGIFNKNEIVFHSFPAAFEDLFVKVFTRKDGTTDPNLMKEIIDFLTGKNRTKAHNGTVHYPGKG